MTPRELNMVCGESNEIYGEKNCYKFLRKNCLLLIGSEKIVRLSWVSKKIV